MSGDLTARDVIARWMCAEETRAHADADDLLAALAAAGWRLERDDQWEWAVHLPCDDEAQARHVASTDSDSVVVRRKDPAEPWEVAPDA